MIPAAEAAACICLCIILSREASGFIVGVYVQQFPFLELANSFLHLKLADEQQYNACQCTCLILLDGDRCGTLFLSAYTVYVIYLLVIEVSDRATELILLTLSYNYRFAQRYSPALCKTPAQIRLASSAIWIASNMLHLLPTSSPCCTGLAFADPLSQLYAQKPPCFELWGKGYILEAACNAHLESVSQSITPFPAT